MEFYMKQPTCQLNAFSYRRYYSATIIKMSGVRSEVVAIWLAAVTAAVNFVFTFLGLYLVEKIGRRPLTLSSMLGKIWSSVFTQCAFLAA